MILGLLAIAIAGLIAYIWASRGFYGALIHMLCTIIAGAIAFAAWEPVSYMLLNASPKGGFLSFLEGVAFALGLVLPFAFSLAILRIGVDSVLRANIIVSSLVNYIGGGLCGVVSGVITTGILLIGVSHMRLSTELVGYQPYTINNSGSVVKESKLIVPLDEITAMLYGSLSERAFAIQEPLAKWHPDLANEGHALRINYGGGKSRNTIKPNEVALLKRYTVNSGDMKDLLSDRWNQASQQAVAPDGSQYAPGSHIEGFLVNFKSGAGEKSGKVITGNGQMRLLVTDPTGEERKMLFPIAVASQAEGDKPLAARWRYDAPEVYIASVGGAAESVFGFEFVVPKDWKPTALYVRGLRIPIEDKPADVAFASSAMRDAAIVNLKNLAMGQAGGSAGTLDTSKAVVIKRSSEGSSQQLPAGIRVGNNVGRTIQLGLHQSLDVDEDGEGRNKNSIRGGEAIWARGDAEEMLKGLERSLRVENFQVEGDITLVHVDVSWSVDGTTPNPLSFLSPAGAPVDKGLPAVLVDVNDQVYVPVGFRYEDDVEVSLRYTPDQPITGVDKLIVNGQAKRLSKSKPDQHLYLIYRATKGAKLKYFAIGDTVLVEFAPPVDVQGF